MLVKCITMHYHVMQDKMWGVCNFVSYCSACCISLIDQVCSCSIVHTSVKWTMYSCWKQNIVTYLSLHYFEYFKLGEEIVDNWVAFISHGSLFIQPQLLSQLFSCTWNWGVNTVLTNFESLSACCPAQLHNSPSPFPCTLYSEFYDIVPSYIVEMFRIPIITLFVLHVLW